MGFHRVSWGFVGFYEALMGFIGHTGLVEFYRPYRRFRV